MTRRTIDSYLRAGEMPEEGQLRRLVARHRLAQAKAVLKRASLNVHAAADVGRRNRDWNPGNASADLAIIPDATTLTARARQLVRDTWVGKSIVRAFKRNIVGRGIQVIPHAKDPAGKPLAALNRVAQRAFLRWAKSKMMDVERKQTFPQKQRQAAAERQTVGEAIWMWSYRVPLGAMNGIDRGKPVGLGIQSFEPEQFDTRILSYEGREVRGGVEVDENGAPVAYHLYTRNPNDVLYRHAFFSQRIPAERIFHYFDSERVLQSRGSVPMACIMQDARDLNRIQGATLTRALMEACIGVLIKSVNQQDGGLPGTSSSTITAAAGDSGQTPSGMSEADFVPGMVGNLRPGEEVEPFIPSAPGNQYDPFVTLTVRGIGAGMGLSFGQLMRHSDGNYSAARQDMLEDRKEFEPEQEMLVDDLIRPVYELWFNFAALEGRFDGVAGFTMEEFLADRARYTDADYISPPQTWIDPQREANAFAVMLANRLITREEIVALRGGRFTATIEKLAVESEEVRKLGMSLPENADELQAMRDLIKALIAAKGVGVDAVTANATDIRGALEKAGVPVRDTYEQPLLPVLAAPGNAITGDPVTDAAGEVIGGGVKETQPPAAAGEPAQTQQAIAGGGRPNAMAGLGAAAQAAPTAQDTIAEQDTRRLGPDPIEEFPFTHTPPPADVPEYRVSGDAVVACASCSYAVGVRCTRFNFTLEIDHVCNDWAAKTLTENIGVPNTAKTFPPGPQPGERGLERSFFPDADPSPRP